MRKKRIMGLAAAALLLAAALALAAGAMNRSGGKSFGGVCPVQISEIQASNALCPDSDGVLWDWVELYNSSAQPFDLGGCGLSDDALEIKYFFPAGTVIPGGGRMVLYCSSDGQNGAAPFGLSRSGGERLCLFTADDILAESVELPPMGKGEVYARTERGWELLEHATPGQENSEYGYGLWLAGRGTTDCPVVLSELMASNRATLPGPAGDFPDWFELYNSGSRPFTLTGWWLGQSSGLPEWVFPELTLAAGERVVILCDGVDGPDFSLAAAGELLCLFAPDGTPAWVQGWERLEDDEVLALREESGLYFRSGEPSPGQPNTAEGALSWEKAADEAAGLCISEVQTSNDRYLRQRDGEYYDWVELYNGSNEPVCLSDYRLSDRADAASAWALPEITLAAGEYYVIICSGDASLSSPYFTHAPFSLGAAGERLYLYDAAGVLRDFCHVRDVPLYGSFGRMAGEKGWFRFTVPSPETPNRNGVRRMAERPESALSQGVYEGVDALEVALSAPGEIRYTLDGSYPTADSPLYKRPLRLSETTVIRAVNMEDGCLPSEAATFSYIINEGHSLPVVSVTADPAELFGAKGIYYVSSKARDQREILGHMAFFDEAGHADGDCGIAIHGASSRNTRLKKSLKMTFRPRYGGHLRYDVFGDGVCSDYFSLVLRSGYMKDHTLLRDEVCAAAALHCTDNVLGLRSRYCAVYLNGEYWGVYALRDAYSATYAANARGTRPDDVFISRAPVRFSHNEELESLYAFLKQRGPAEEKQRRIAAEFDLESLADWMVLQAYFTNYDLPGNIRYIRTADDQPWQMAFFDLDFGLRVADVTWDHVLDPVNEFGNLTRTVAAWPEFQDLLFRRMAALFAAGLNESSCLAALDEYCAAIAGELAREYQRWGEGAGELETTRAELRGMIQSNRQRECVDSLCRALGLDSAQIRAEYFGGMELE